MKWLDQTHSMLCVSDIYGQKYEFHCLVVFLLLDASGAGWFAAGTELCHKGSCHWGSPILTLIIDTCPQCLGCFAFQGFQSSTWRIDSICCNLVAWLNFFRSLYTIQIQRKPIFITSVDIIHSSVMSLAKLLNYITDTKSLYVEYQLTFIIRLQNSFVYILWSLYYQVPCYCMILFSEFACAALDAIAFLLFFINALSN
jgi:hypothetical protein